MNRSREEMLAAAARGVIERMSSTLSNGKGIEADDGEMCWIVHSDDIEALRAAIAREDDGG